MEKGVEWIGPFPCPPRSLLSADLRQGCSIQCWGACGVPRRNKIRSVRRGPNDEIEAGGCGERTEIPVSRKQLNPVIDTALGDQCIVEARLAALCQHFRP